VYKLKLVAQSNLFLQTRSEISPFSYLIVKVNIIQLLMLRLRIFIGAAP